MDIFKLLDKLEPLIPEQAKRWRLALPLVDEPTRDMLARHIISKANELLADADRRLILSLPPEDRAKGEIHLGRVLYEKERWAFGISRKELLQNLAIFGRSGAGKTNTAFILLQQLVNARVPFLFLDWKRTGRHLIPELNAPVRLFTPGRSVCPFPFNPLVPPPGLERRVYVNIVVDLLSTAFTLGDGSRSILQSSILKAYESISHPTVSDALAILQGVEVKNRATGWKMSAMRALKSLQAMQCAPEANQEDLVHSLADGNTILELDSLSDGEKKFLIPLLCLWVFYEKLASPIREELQLAILVEEAHHVFHTQKSSHESVMEMLLRQCRELGVCMIIVDQHPHLISSAVLGNVYTSICLNLKDPADINRAAALCLLDEAEKRHVSMLPVGQGIVKLQDRWPKPFLVRFPAVHLHKGHVTDSALKAISGPTVTLSRSPRPAPALNAAFGRSRPFEFVPDDEAFVLLQDVLSHPDAGVDSRYKRLSWSADKGNRLKNQLLKAGLLQQEVLSVGRTRRVLLRLTPSARQELGAGKSSERGSLVHEYWKRHYANLLAAHGYAVELEAPRRSGRVDVLARKDGRTIAVEVETGKSDTLLNVRADLLSGFDLILVVATDEAALQKLEKELASSGLLLPRRVQLILRDKLESLGEPLTTN